MKMSYDKDWGSHLPILTKIVRMTDGPVLEMGMGIFSTPFLHWMCFPKRKLVSYENDPGFFEFLKQYQQDFHDVHFVEDWDKIDIKKDWDVVFIDHKPSRRRIIDIKKLATRCQFMLIHDTQRNFKFCNYKEIWPLFKYRYDYKEANPWTTVLSNFHDLEFLK